MEWCDVESDPAIFTELVKKIECENIQCEELYAIDDVASINARFRLHGLIFLFKYRTDVDARSCYECALDTFESEEAEEKEEEGEENGKELREENDNDDDADGSNENDRDEMKRTKKTSSYPESLFFASQVITNACATQALLSVLLNIEDEDVDIGGTLKELKEFTADFPADLKGVAISNSEKIREAHNAFARPEPIMMEEGKRKMENGDEVFHYCAFVHHKGRCWELDGLKAKAVAYGECTKENWHEVVKPVIEERIQRYSADENSFNLIAVMNDKDMIFSKEMEVAKASGDNETINSLNQDMEFERHRKALWKEENIRRKHNYIPFIFEMLRCLAEKDALGV